MRLFQHYHNRKYHNVVRREFWDFELSVWLHMVGRSLISIFIPVLIIKSGFPLWAVLFYYILMNLFDVPLNFVARRFILSYGARLAIILATLAGIIYFINFGWLSGGGYAVIIVLAFLDAVYDAFYWVGHLYLFFESSQEPEQAGQNTGTLESVRSLAGMLGPGIGAIILLFGNQGPLLAASSIFFALSILPLLRLRHIKDKPRPTGVTVRQFFSTLREKRDYLSLGFSNLHWPVENILWPLFIFSLYGTLRSIAWVAIIVSIGKIIFSYVAGTVTKKSGDTLIVVGSTAIVLIWVARLLYPHDIFYYASILLTGFFAIMIDIPIESNIVERARLKDSLLASTVRNATTMIPQFLIFSLLAILVQVFKVSFLVAIGSLIMLIVINRLFLVWMKRENHGTV